ncbi:hypothetical protein BDQ12DRAFT_688420 [Crucibulum laeve]|uniref:Uncharacterized protein n=1 Tax=Crucibulum laeve TaxID=68775 RepID=A0A5C3LTD7_9AGAR|nr:hypothetical protein BDQ12DRAFT_688420 [Crucibulum laeve]
MSTIIAKDTDHLLHFAVPKAKPPCTIQLAAPCPTLALKRKPQLECCCLPCVKAKRFTKHMRLVNVLMLLTLLDNRFHLFAKESLPEGWRGLLGRIMVFLSSFLAPWQAMKCMTDASGMSHTGGVFSIEFFKIMCLNVDIITDFFPQVITWFAPEDMGFNIGMFVIEACILLVISRYEQAGIYRLIGVDKVFRAWEDQRA